jgi:isoleucyl-tRNA synthetase
MSEPASNNKYRDTLNLPQTAFPMKADLVKREPEFLKKWEEEKLYQQVLKKNAGRPKYILHDGPPYANGNIHFGHILNKVIKDIIIKHKNMTGFYSPYVPGWDCHGLPIEHQVDKDLGSKKKEMSKLDIRRECRKYAAKFVEIQKNDFRRLGIFGDWDNPYLTMNFGYEAQIAREFGKFVREGNVYNALRPVLWCSHCRTALADAETEYEDKESSSVYVRFPLVDKIGDKEASIVIWTTTPWTLPANLGIALHENYDYIVLPYQSEYFVVAKQLSASFCQMLGIEEPEPVDRFPGKKLEGKLARHPFLNRTSKIVLSGHVTMDTGTGAVHIAPGHGEDDYLVGLKNGLAILSPVDHAGRLTDEAGLPELTGLKVLTEANPKIIELLKEKGTLLHEEKIRHAYPHCWRCKNPLIFRATEQYFLSLEKNGLKAKALDAIRRTHWVPAWGRERIYGMIERRGDWCLSRQRSWGVPIISFRCADCSSILLDASIIEKIADKFETEGSDLWFNDAKNEELIPLNHPCPKCSGKKWLRENHILDVWFDSGISFAAVLEKRPELKFPADLYLEGSDQHRGWFHSSLLCSIGTRGQAPYQTVLTHGFVVDGNGKKYSKSAQNYVPPEKILGQSGAEILRLWVAAEDYRNDIRVSQEILTRLTDAYRKIRNTCRFILSNLYDFNPSQMGVWGKSGISPHSERASGSAGVSESLSEIDKWCLHQLQKLTGRVQKAYEEFSFHAIFHELNRFFTVDLSSFYLDILKDRLYTSAKNDPLRRGAQKVLFEVISTLSRLMAPILTFTSEEIWQQIPNFPGKAASVHLADFPEPQAEFIDETLAGRWENFRKIRDEVLKILEKSRQEKVIGNSLEAKLSLVAQDEPLTFLKSFGDSLKELLQVSQISWGDSIGEKSVSSEAFPKLFIEVAHADGAKCERCWSWSNAVGADKTHPTLCERCVSIVT